MQIGWEISTTIVEYHFWVQIIISSPCKLGGRYRHCKISFLGSNYHQFTMQIGWDISTAIVEYHFWVKMNVKYHQFTMQIGWEISTAIVEYHFWNQNECEIPPVHHANWVGDIYCHCRISFLGSNYHLFTMQIGWEISTAIVEYHFWIKMNVKYHQFTMQIGWEISTAIVEYHFWIKMNVKYHQFTMQIGWEISTAIVEYHFWIQIIICSPCKLGGRYLLPLLNIISGSK
jgi:hypothetical protein